MFDITEEEILDKARELAHILSNVEDVLDSLEAMQTGAFDFVIDMVRANINKPEFAKVFKDTFYDNESCLSYYYAKPICRDIQVNKNSDFLDVISHNLKKDAEMYLVDNHADAEDERRQLNGELI